MKVIILIKVVELWEKKRYVIVLAIILIFALIPVGVFADENKVLDVQLAKLELQNDIVFYSMLLMFTTAMIVRFKKKNN